MQCLPLLFGGTTGESCNSLFYNDPWPRLEWHFLTCTTIMVGQLRHLGEWLVPVTPGVVESHLAYVLQQLRALPHVCVSMHVGKVQNFVLVPDLDRCEPSLQ